MKKNKVGFSIIQKWHNSLKTKKTTVSYLYQRSFNLINKYKTLHSVSWLLIQNRKLEKLEKLDFSDDNKLLNGILYVCKDNIATKRWFSTGSSKHLINFIPNYNATCIENLKKQNTLLVAKTNLDELGLGGDGLSASQGYVHNPWDQNHITGGSSSGSVALVATGIVPFAIGTETGDSIRLTASYTGTVGFKPTYGIISRWGLFPYSPSFDTIGVIANFVTDVAIVMDGLISKDEFDYSLLNKPYYENKFYKSLDKHKVYDYKIAYIKDIIEQLPPNIKKKFYELIDILKKNNIFVKEVRFPKKLLTLIPLIYLVITYTEAISCLNNLNGITFSTRTKGTNYKDIIKNSRNDCFGKTLKRRFIIASYILNYEPELINKSKKIRRTINLLLNKILKNYDLVIFPSSENEAPTIEDTINTKLNINSIKKNIIKSSLLLFNFNGAPSINIPWILNNNLPIGLNVTSYINQDQKVLNGALYLEEIIKFIDIDKFKKNKVKI